MKKLKVTLSLFMVILILCVSVAPTFAVIAPEDSASSEISWTDKIDELVWDKMNNASGNEKITISIWFDDIDYDSVYDGVVESLKKKGKIDSIDSKCIEIAFDTQSLSFDDVHSFSEVDTEELNLVLEEKRSTTSEKYFEHNRQQIEIIEHTLNKELSNNLVKYICKYAPNIELSVTKDEIYSMASISTVTSIGLVSNSTLVEESTAVSSTYPIDTSFYNAVGIHTVRDAFRRSGRNMKVGMLEAIGFVQGNSITTHDTYRVYGTGTATSMHANAVAKIMVGYIDDYVGAIPNAELYYASCNNSINNVKPAIEALIDAGVTAINCSFGFSNDRNSYNDMAKWYDHISAQHSVHLILAAGNFGANGVCSDNMSYNAIVVGNCDNNGLIHTTSSYNSINNSAYKPDIVAPGVDRVVLQGYPSGSGTSFSAPLVTSAVIQLAETNAVLCSSPALMKSVLLSSSRITSSMVDEPMISTQNNSSIALSRVYGAGMLSVSNAYVSVHDKEYYFNGTATPELNSFTYSKNISKSVGKTVRVCLTWDKITYASGNHSTSNILDADLDKFRLTVTTPSGISYCSDYLYDNKQMISFVSTENGIYNFTVQRISTLTSDEEIDYAITFSVK